MAMFTHYLLTGEAPDSHVVRKTATDPAARERLVHEAAMLGLAQRPGVVEVAGLFDGEEATELTLRMAGDRMHIPGSLAPAQAASLLQDLATTVADLHERGVTHGRIGIDHLVLDAAGHPVLCGFGDAWAHTGVDPARLARGQAADVAALGELLTLLLAPGSDIAVLPEHRHHLSAEERLREQRDGERRALLTLADQAAAADVERRPSAARFAELLSRASPTPDRAATGEPTAAAAGFGDLPSAGRIGAAGAESPATQRLARPEPLRRLVPPLPQLRWRSALPSASSLERLRSLPFRAAGIALLALTGLGLLTTGVASLRHGSRPHLDGPVEASIRVAGRTVTVGSRRFELGQAGDLVTLGSWRCDGSTMPALLRPSTGEVFVFDSWASPGHDVTVHPTAVMPGARSLQATPAAGGCMGLSVVLADGTMQAVPLPEAGS
jgi:hypothetical protein